MMYLVLFVTQFLFQFLRTVGTIFNVRLHLWRTALFTGLIQALWLFTTYVGVTAIIKNDFFGVFVYIISGVVGSMVGILFLKGGSSG